MSAILLALLSLATLSQSAHLSHVPRKNDGRIVGGAQTPIERNPWQVSIQTFGLHSCGGSIISPEWVVSAAHCVNWLFTPFYVIVTGTNDLRQPGTRVGVRDTYTHNEYDGISNDVGLFRLAQKLTFGSTIQPIPLASVEPQANSSVTVTGFGLLHSSDWLTPTLLYGVEVSIVSRAICQSDYQNLEGAEVDETMICAGVPEGGKDACQGDSGGPLTQNGTLVGIVSWGNGCALPKYPGVYTNIAQVREWIKLRTGV